MAIKDLLKSGWFAVAVFAAFVLWMPFLAEKVGDLTGLYDFPVSKWVKGLFATQSPDGTARTTAKIDWERQLGDLEEFSNWAAGQSEVKISIIRPEVFQIVRADPNPATAARFSWKLQLLSDKLSLSAAQVRSRLTLICEPESGVSGEIQSVKPLKGDEKGFLVTVAGVKGEGKMGLSYAGLPPVFYDVKLRRMWLVPVAGCRSAVRNRYDAAVFFPGMERGMPEGGTISPGNDKCGYRILSVSDNCVWFEAYYGNEPPEDQLPHNVWPDFSRVDTLSPTPPPGRLIFGRNRCFWPGDAIKLPNSGFYLMVDDLLAGKAAVFRLLDATMRPVRELLCVIVREK
ncbi:MAG: hypothetical protein ACI4Q3_00060 [Kiritimatiellia bacterium]